MGRQHPLIKLRLDASEADSALQGFARSAERNLNAAGVSGRRLSNVLTGQGGVAPSVEAAAAQSVKLNALASALSTTTVHTKATGMALRDINRTAPQLSGLSAILAGMNPHVANLRRQIGGNNGLVAGFTLLGRQRSALTRLASGLAGPKGIAFAAAAAGASFTGMAVAAARFESSIIRLQTQLNISDQAFAQASDQVLDLAGDYGVAVNTLADAQFAIQSAGLRGADGLLATETAAKLAAIQFGTAREAGVLLAAAINAYGKENLTAARAGEIFLATVDQGKVEATELTRTLGRVFAPAAQLGIAIEEVNAAIATYTRLGVPTAEASNAVRGAIFALIKPSSQAKAIFEEVGLTVTDLHRRIREHGFVDTLRFLRNEVASSDEEFARIVPRIRGYGASLALTNDEAALFNEIHAKVAGSVGRLDGAVERVQDTTANKWNQAMQSANSLLIDTGQLILPLVNEGLDVLNFGLDAAGDAFDFFFGKSKADAVSEFNSRVGELVDTWGRFAETDAEKQQVQIEAILRAISESGGDVDKLVAALKALEPYFEEDTETPATAAQRATLIGDIRKTAEKGFVGAFRQPSPIAAQAVENFFQASLSGAGGAFQNFDVLDEFRENVAPTFESLQDLWRQAGQDPIDVRRIWVSNGRDMSDSILEVADVIAKRLNIAQEDAIHLAIGAVIPFADEAEAARQLAAGAAEAGKNVPLLRDASDAVNVASSAYGFHAEAVDEVKRKYIDLKVPGENVIENMRNLGFATAFVADETPPYIQMLRDMNEEFENTEGAAKAYREEIERQLKVIQLSAAAQRHLAELEEQRFSLGEVGFARAVELVFDTLIKGVTDLNVAIATTNSLIVAPKVPDEEDDRIKRLIDSYRELGRVGAQTYERISDAIEDEREVARRGFEDRRFQLEEEFDLELTALRSNLSIGRKELQFAEEILRGQQRATLRSIDRQGTLADRVFADRLEEESDEQRILSQFVANTTAQIGRLEQQGISYEQILKEIAMWTKQTAENTRSVWPGRITTDQIRQVHEATGGAVTPPPTVTSEQADFWLLLRQARGLGIDLPPGVENAVRANQISSAIQVLRHMIQQAQPRSNVRSSVPHNAGSGVPR